MAVMTHFRTARPVGEWACRGTKRGVGAAGRAAMLAEADLSPTLADLLFAGLDHGIDTVRGGRELTPFVVTQVHGQRSLARMAADTIGDAVRQGSRLIRETDLAGDDCAVLVYDGYLETTQDGRLDAVYAKGRDASGHVVTIAQRYKPKAFLRAWQPIGHPAMLPDEGSDF